MFNACPQCGEYTDTKEIVGSPSRAICLVCRHEHRFLSLPLFIVTGASGAGKTTAALELTSHTQDFVILDQDILWCDAFNKPDDNFQLFRNTWLRLIKNIHQAGKSVVLFGSSIPEQFEGCVERRYMDSIHYLALVCEPTELKKRLLERPKWRNSASAENLERMVEFNHWLKENASKTQPNMVLLDTSMMTATATARSIHDWLAATVAGG